MFNALAFMVASTIGQIVVNPYIPPAVIYNPPPVQVIQYPVYPVYQVYPIYPIYPVYRPVYYPAYYPAYYPVRLY